MPLHPGEVTLCFGSSVFIWMALFFLRFLQQRRRARRSNVPMFFPHLKRWLGRLITCTDRRHGQRSKPFSEMQNGFHARALLLRLQLIYVFPMWHIVAMDISITAFSGLIGNSSLGLH
jgi:hypothetical protein